MGSNPDGYLAPLSYCIGFLDLVSAMLFAFISGVVFAKHGKCSALVALVFTSIWILMIVILLAGVFKRKSTLVRLWLIFTCLGIVLDGLILLYGLTLAISVNWEGVKITVLPFMGLAVEMTFVYIIYLFYLDMIGCGAQRSFPCEPPFIMLDAVQPSVQEVNEKPMDRKELKRLEKQAKERRKKEKALRKEQQKQKRKGVA
ncbi:hypothetical protein KR018_011869 [Drosophila ironensis]|nr:hypothetical protein KR018_011869 [Drosophila ironensis]